jgi:uncharacterized protein (DUF488 family)
MYITHQELKRILDHRLRPIEDALGLIQAEETQIMIDVSALEASVQTVETEENTTATNVQAAGVKFVELAAHVTTLEATATAGDAPSQEAIDKLVTLTNEAGASLHATNEALAADTTSA